MVKYRETWYSWALFIYFKIFNFFNCWWNFLKREWEKKQTTIRLGIKALYQGQSQERKKRGKLKHQDPANETSLSAPFLAHESAKISSMTEMVEHLLNWGREWSNLIEKVLKFPREDSYPRNLSTGIRRITLHSQGLLEGTEVNSQSF